MTHKKWIDKISWQTCCEPTSGKQLEVALVAITPELAKEMLVDSVNYRNKDLQRIQKYKDTMEAGEWEVNAATITFDKNDTNLDGQHRLLSCAESGFPFVSLVVRGVDSAMETDRGKARKFGDALRFAKIKNSTIVASAASLCYAYEKKGISFVTAAMYYPTCAQGMAWIEENPIINDIATLSMAAKKLHSCSTLTAILVLGIKIANLPVTKAEQFVQGVANDVEGNFNDARHQLHNRLVSNAISKAKLLRRDMAAMTIKAWNRWNLGLSSTAASIRWTPGNNEPFPEFVKATDL